MVMKLIFISAVLICCFVSLSQVNPLYINGSNFFTDNLISVNDTVYGSWNYLTPMGNALLGVNAIYITESDRIFIAGGANSSAVPTVSCRWYNLSSDTYDPAPPLPVGRWSGKLVRVKNNLYLIGSIGSSFSQPDGLIFRYSLASNSWAISDTMNSPFVLEPAVSVINDSLILITGGSTNGFQSPVNRVRLFNTVTRSWKNLFAHYPINVTTAHSEVLKISDSLHKIVVVGGYSSGPVNVAYLGNLLFSSNDSISIGWNMMSDFPFNGGVYRVTGGRFGNLLLFGPGMRGPNAVNQIFGLRISGDSLISWLRFLPNEPDSAANIPTYAVKRTAGNDSGYFYFFGGYRNLNALNSARRYSFRYNMPIGLINNEEHYPSEFMLFQNYPNPFNPHTRIRFQIPGESFTELSVYDLLGRKVQVLVSEVLKSGVYEMIFNGEKLSSGVYVVVLHWDRFRKTNLMVLIK